MEPELIHYKSFDGREIPAWFYRPTGSSSDATLPPVIVYPHGGPESQTRPNFTALFQYFLQDGYAILTVRKTERGFELLRVSAHGSEALESFEHCEDAVQRWNQMEKDIRRTLQPTSNHPEGERDVDGPVRRALAVSPPNPDGHFTDRAMTFSERVEGLKR